MTEDHFAIQQAITAYALRTGRGDWAPVLALFTPDAVWSVPHLGLRAEGHAAIREALVMLTDDLDYVLQHNAPALITVSGESATARSGIREAGRRKDRAGQPAQGFEFFGIYADTLVRTADRAAFGGWRFSARVFEHIGTQFGPLSPARPAAG